MTIPKRREESHESTEVGGGIDEHQQSSWVSSRRAYKKQICRAKRVPKAERRLEDSGRCRSREKQIRRRTDQNLKALLPSGAESPPVPALLSTDPHRPPRLFSLSHVNSRRFSLEKI